MKKHIQERIERNRALGKLDRANRCAFCKSRLTVGYLTILDSEGNAVRYCDDGCRLDQIDAVQTMEARR